MRIGIIGGGGAGLTAAWLLEEEHDVTLYERATRLGGHAWAIPVEVAGQTYPIDVGFEFFSASMFPTFGRLLRRLDVPLRPYAASITLYSRERVRVLPPSRAGRLYCSGLGPRPLADLVRLVYLLRRADDLMRRRDTTVTLQAFVDSTPLLSQAFKEEFLALPEFMWLTRSTAVWERRTDAFPSPAIASGIGSWSCGCHNNGVL